MQHTEPEGMGRGAQAGKVALLVGGEGDGCISATRGTRQIMDALRGPRTYLGV